MMKAQAVCFVALNESIKLIVRLILIFILTGSFVGLSHHPFCLQLVLTLFGINFQFLKLLCLAKDH